MRENHWGQLDWACTLDRVWLAWLSIKNMVMFWQKTLKKANKTMTMITKSTWKTYMAVRWNRMEANQLQFEALVRSCQELTRSLSLNKWATSWMPMWKRNLQSCLQRIQLLTKTVKYKHKIIKKRVSTMCSESKPSINQSFLDNSQLLSLRIKSMTLK